MKLICSKCGEPIDGWAAVEHHIYKPWGIDETRVYHPKCKEIHEVEELAIMEKELELE